MSLRRVRIIYGCSVVATAILFAAANTPIHRGAAVVVLLTAVPWFRVFNSASELAGATKALKRLRQHLTTGEVPGEADPHH